MQRQPKPEEPWVDPVEILSAELRNLARLPTEASVRARQAVETVDRAVEAICGDLVARCPSSTVSLAIVVGDEHARYCRLCHRPNAMSLNPSGSPR